MKRLIPIFLGLLLLLFGCGGDKAKEVDAPPPEGSARELDAQWNCAWYVYWDADVADEFVRLKGKFNAASMFSCFFSENGELYIPENFARLKRIGGMLDVSTVYLSITNDVLRADGSTAQKDADFTKTLLAREQGREAVADRILSLARSMCAQGIEIDFENVEEPELWTEYVRFLNVMWEKAQERGLSMRIVLSVHAPVEDPEFPDGPEYTVMCYNLYGTHSGPGPKADADFLRETAEKFSARRNMVYALATGGFAWGPDEQTVTAVTEADAKLFTVVHDITPQRDEASGALFFSYEEKGETNTVWYADEQTLAFWREVILDTDPDAVFDLWRVGGNVW